MTLYDERRFCWDKSLPTFFHGSESHLVENAIRLSKKLSFPKHSHQSLVSLFVISKS